MEKRDKLTILNTLPTVGVWNSNIFDLTAHFSRGPSVLKILKHSLFYGPLFYGNHYRYLLDAVFHHGSDLRPLGGGEE